MLKYKIESKVLGIMVWDVGWGFEVLMVGVGCRSRMEMHRGV